MVLNHWQSGGDNAPTIYTRYWNAYPSMFESSLVTYNQGEDIEITPCGDGVEPGTTATVANYDEYSGANLGLMSTLPQFKYYFNSAVGWRRPMDRLDLLLTPGEYTNATALDVSGMAVVEADTTDYSAITPIRSLFSSNGYDDSTDIYREGLLARASEIKRINIICGAFFWVDRSSDNGRFVFNYCNARLSFHSTVQLGGGFRAVNSSRTNYPYPPSAFSDLYPVWASLISKIHFWIPYPSLTRHLFEPVTYFNTYYSGALGSSRTKTEIGAYRPPFQVMYGLKTDFTTESYNPPYYNISSVTNSFGQICNPHIHLPNDYDKSMLALKPDYIPVCQNRTWTHEECTDEDYCKKIYVTEVPMTVSNPSTSIVPASGTYHEFSSIGEFQIHYDIDPSLDIETNVKRYTG